MECDYQGDNDNVHTVAESDTQPPVRLTAWGFVSSQNHNHTPRERHSDFEAADHTRRYEVTAGKEGIDCQRSLA